MATSNKMGSHPWILKDDGTTGTPSKSVRRKTFNVRLGEVIVIGLDRRSFPCLKAPDDEEALIDATERAGDGTAVDASEEVGEGQPDKSRILRLDLACKFTSPTAMTSS